jgi:hypothetical protein
MKASGPEIHRYDALGKWLPMEKIRELSLYQQPEFLDIVAPDKAWVAKMGDTSWYFPFCGDKWLWRWRVFQVAYCQRLDPVPGPEAQKETAWNSWMLFLKDTWMCKWSTGSLPPGSGMYPGLHFVPKTNQFLPLDVDFSSLMGKWKSGRKSALKKSEALDVRQLDAGEFRTAFRQIYNQPSGKAWRPTDREERILLQLSSDTFFQNHLRRFAVFSDNEPLCLVLLLRWKERDHYLFSMSSDRGFQMDALTRFFYSYFQSEAGKKRIFDFEGSSLPGVKAFFQSLGADEEAYGVWER